MNGKIKTKFAALFAVALMITVCLVPVVGNDGVEAAVTKPSDAESVIIDGTIFSAQGGSAKISNVELIISTGNATYTVFDADGEYNKEIYVPKGTVIETLTVTLNVTDSKIMNGTKEVDNGAYGLWNSNPALIFEKVVAEQTLSNVDFKAGHVSISGKLTYGDGNTLYKTSAQVSLYERTGSGKEDDPYEYTSTGFSATSVDGMYTMFVPAHLKNNVEKSVFVMGASIPSDSYSASTFTIAEKNVTSDIKSSTTGVLKITASSNAKEYEDTITVTAAEKSNVNVGAYSANISNENKEVLVEYTFGTKVDGGNSKVVIEGQYGRKVEVPLSAISNTVSATYYLTKYVSGTVKMTVGSYSVNAIGVVNLNIINADDAIVGSFSGEITDGNYIIWYTGDLTGAKKAEVVYSFNSVDSKENITSFIDGDSYPSNITVTSTGYQYVSGTIKNQRGGVLKNVDVVVGGNNVFGLNNGKVTTDSKGVYRFMAPANEFVKITPDSTFNYNVASADVNVKQTNKVDFIMNDQTVKVSVEDYKGDGLKGVKAYRYIFDEENEEWKSNGSTALGESDENGKISFPVNGNEDLSRYFIGFDGVKVDGYDLTFKNNYSNPIAVSEIDNAVQVIETYNKVKIVNYDGEVLYGLETLEVLEYDAFIEDGVEVFTKKSKKYSLTPVKDYYYFVAAVGSQEITSDVSTILAVALGNTAIPGNIFEEVNVISESGTTLIEAYAEKITGTVYESDEKTVIKSLGGAEISVKSATVSNYTESSTNKVKKDGTFEFLVKERVDSNAVIEFDTTGYDYTFDAQNVYKDDVKVTSFYANQMSFDVSFADADGKKVEYRSAGVKVVDTSEMSELSSEGKVVLDVAVGYEVKGNLDPLDYGYLRDFKPIEITEEIVSSKKLNFVSTEATYTLTVTDSKGSWELFDIEMMSELQIVKIDEYGINYDVTWNDIGVDNNKFSILATVPDEGQTYAVVGGGFYFSDSPVEFSNNAATIKALGSFEFVKVADAEGNILSYSNYADKVDVDDVDDGNGNQYPCGLIAFSGKELDEYVELEAMPIGIDELGLMYFALEGVEYKFLGGFINDEYGYDYTFINIDGYFSGAISNYDYSKIAVSAKDGVIKANQQTVEGIIETANGFEFDVPEGIVKAYMNAEELLGIPVFKEYLEGVEITEGLDGSYNSYSFFGIPSLITDYVLYDADGKELARSATPDFVVAVSYYTATIPAGLTVDYVLYNGDKVVKSETMGADGIYMDISKGDKLVAEVYYEGKLAYTTAVTTSDSAFYVPGTFVKVGNELFGDHFEVYGAGKEVIGSVLVLTAETSCSVRMDDFNVAYKTYEFAGWYVNGVKVSDNANATYTVNGPCEIYAYYTEKVTETGVVEAAEDNSNELSMDVLVLGIVIVLIALLAFAYAVKFKKE